MDKTSDKLGYPVLEIGSADDIRDTSEYPDNNRKNCERFEPRSHFKRLSLIVRVNVVLNRTVVDSD